MKICELCDGMGEICSQCSYIEPDCQCYDEDEDGELFQNSYLETCDECNGEGEIED